MAELSARVTARYGEIEQAILARVYTVSDPGEAADPIYLEGLRAAVSIALAYGLEAVKHDHERPPPVPDALLAQARIAARSGVSVETILRRYIAGYTLLGDVLIDEAEDLLEGAQLKRLLRVQATLLDRVLEAVSAEYAQERSDRSGTTEQRRIEHIQRILAGEPLDASELAYDLDASHLGLIAAGPNPTRALRELAQAMGRPLLSVLWEEEIAWAWIGGRSGIDAGEVEGRVLRHWPAQISLAIGEAGQGRSGWRLTHRQAKAVLPVALRGRQQIVRYADAAVVASMLRDDLLRDSLRESYLTPLSDERDGGMTLRQTLRAYFVAGGNVSSAAAILGVSRRTVSNRLNVIDAKLDRPLSASATEMDLALRLEELDGGGDPKEQSGKSTN